MKVENFQLIMVWGCSWLPSQSQNMTPQQLRLQPLTWRQLWKKCQLACHSPALWGAFPLQPDWLLFWEPTGSRFTLWSWQEGFGHESVSLVPEIVSYTCRIHS